MELVLIHGMGRTPLSMLVLRQRLRRRGHTARLFGYAPAIEPLEHASDRLVRLISHRFGDRPYALIGHSLGTVIIRHALARLGTHQPAACFFLAPPMVACSMARVFSRFWPYRALTGEMGRLLAREDFMSGLPLPPIARIYAGTGGPRAAWLPLGHEPNDMILTVEEATGGTAVPVVKVPATHTFIMNSRAVFNDMAEVLETLV